MRSTGMVTLSVCLLAVLLIPSAAYGNGNGGVPPTAVSLPESANVVFGVKAGGGSSKISQTVIFDGSGSTANKNADVVAWDWEFGDGTTSSGVTVTHAYTAVGAYTVTLTVTDNCTDTGTDTSKVYVDEITWETIGVGNSGFHHSVAVDPNNSSVVYASGDAESGIMKTTNGATTWQILNDRGIIGTGHGKSSYGIERITIDKTDSNIVFLSSWSGLFKSTSAGGNWTDLNFPSTSPFYISGVDIDPQSTNTIYAGCGCFAVETYNLGTKVYRSTDGGTNWSSITYDGDDCLIDENANVFTVKVDPDTTNHYIYLATNKGFFRSTDSGANWEKKGTGAGEFPVQFCRDLALSYESSSTVTALYVTIKTTVDGTNWDGGVWKSTDRGNTWVEKNDDLPQYTYESSNGYEPTEYKRIAAHPSNPNLVFVGLKNQTYNGTNGSWRTGLFKSTDGGDNWEWLTRNTNMEHGCLDVISQGWTANSFALSSDASVIYCPPYMSTNEGTDWKQFYADKMTTNAPVNWNTRGGELRHPCHVTVDPADGDNLYVACHDIGFWRSTNGGSSFFFSTTDADGYSKGNRPRTTPAACGIFQIALDPDSSKSSFLYETAGAKIHTTNVGSFFMSTDTGDNWSEKDDGGNLPEAAIPSFLIFEDTQDTNQRVIYAASYGQGFYRGTFNTSDYGISWAKKGTNPGNELGTTNNQLIRQLIADPDDDSHQTLYAAIQWDLNHPTSSGYYGGLYRTTDAGDNWIQIDDDGGSHLPNCRASALDPENSNVIYAATWEHTNGTNVFKGGVWRGTYDTQTSNWSWTLKLTDPSGNATYVETVNIDSDDTAYPSDKNLIYASLFEDWWGIHCDNPGIYVSPDDGDTWFIQNDNLQNTVTFIDIDPTDVRRLYLNTDGSGVQRGKFDGWQ